jgi:hypothetical protein
LDAPSKKSSEVEPVTVLTEAQRAFLAVVLFAHRRDVRSGRRPTLGVRLNVVVLKIRCVRNRMVVDEAAKTLALKNLLLLGIADLSFSRHGHPSVLVSASPRA